MSISFATCKRFELTLTVFQSIKREWNRPKYVRELYWKRLLPCISCGAKIVYVHSEIRYLRVAHLSLIYSMICPRKSRKLSSVDFKYSTAEHLTNSTYYLYAPIKGRLNSWLPTQVLVVWVFLKGRRGWGIQRHGHLLMIIPGLKVAIFKIQKVSVWVSVES